MRKITLLLITLFITSTMLMAQGGPRRGEHRGMNIKERAEQMAEQMTKEYSLNDTQKRQVYEANLIMMADMQPSHKQGSGARRHPGFDKKKGDADSKCNAAVDRPSKENREEMMKERKEKRMAEMKKSREEYDTKLKGIFTKAQYEAYAKNQVERQKRMEEKRNSKTQPANN